MTTAGIITMVVSVSLVWGLFGFCCYKLLTSKKKKK